MRRIAVTAVVVAVVAASCAVPFATAQFPDMAFGEDGTPPVHANFGARRRRGGHGSYTPPSMGGANSFERRGAQTPGMGDGPGGSEDWGVPPEGFDGSDMMDIEDRQRRMGVRGDEPDIDPRFGRPDEQQHAPLGEDEGEEMEPGRRGWVRTGRYRRDGDPEPRRATPSEVEDASFDTFMKNQGELPDFDDSVSMEKRFTGMDREPSKTRRRKSKSVARPGEGDAEEIGADGLPVAEVDTAECFRAAIKMCPIRLMHDDFARFASCIVDHRERMLGSCEGWAETHGDCAPDMVHHCPSMAPPATTQCLVAKKKKLSSVCSESEFFRAMEEGFDQMSEKLDTASTRYAAAAATEAAAFEDENGPNGPSDTDGAFEDPGEDSAYGEDVPPSGGRGAAFDRSRAVGDAPQNEEL